MRGSKAKTKNVFSLSGLILLLSVSLISCTQTGEGVTVHRYGPRQAPVSSPNVFGVHSVQKGETLWTIAQAYQVDLRDLLDMNGLQPPYKLGKGARVRIPAPRTYTAHKGDTLYRVSRMFNTTTTELARLNNFEAPYKLTKGQTLQIPGHATPSLSYAQNTRHQPQPQQAVMPENHTKIESEALPPPTTIKTEKAPVLASATSATKPKIITEPPLKRSASGFLRPVSGPVISSYGRKADGMDNDGINIKAPKGTGVRAAENGTIVYTGDNISGYGNLVLIRHADGYVTAYAHLDKILARKGDRVKRGQTIGTVGTSGHVETPQLHFEIRKGKEAINPATVI